MEKGFIIGQEIQRAVRTIACGKLFESVSWACYGYFIGVITFFKTIKEQTLSGSKEMGGHRWQRTKQ